MLFACLSSFHLCTGSFGVSQTLTLKKMMKNFGLLVDSSLKLFGDFPPKRSQFTNDAFRATLLRYVIARFDFEILSEMWAILWLWNDFLQFRNGLWTPPLILTSEKILWLWMLTKGRFGYAVFAKFNPFMLLTILQISIVKFSLWNLQKTRQTKFFRTWWMFWKVSWGWPIW